MSRGLRKFQAELVARARELVLGTITDKVTTADVTPGGGKSLGAALFARELLDAGFIKGVVWQTPRISLAEQAALGFRNAENPRYALRIADNKPPFFRDQDSGCIGYTTTYQAVSKCPELHEMAFDSHPGGLLLILDELHHLIHNDDGAGDAAEQRAWTESLRPLFEKAKHVLVLSGTLERWDREPIPFVSYEQNEAGMRVPVRHIRYTRREALAERAILPIEIKLEEGRATYRHLGSDVTQDIGTAEETEVSRVIRTILADSEFRESILRRGLEDWIRFREACYASRAIVICADQDMAREVQDFIRAEFNVGVVLAISDELRSRETLRRFRDEKLGDVLVTVGMAYEGLDVPDCTHLVCLTHIRSRPWLEQAFARISRVDKKAETQGVTYESQRGYVYAPRDPRMQAVVDAIRQEQELGLADAHDIEEAQHPATADCDTDDDVGLETEDNGFHPISAESTGVRYGSVEDGQLSAEASAQVEQVKAAFPELANTSSRRLLQLASDLRQPSLQSFLEGTRRFADGTTSQRPYDPLEEQRLRKTIEEKARRVDRRQGGDYGATNQEIVKRFKKSREEMGVGELRRVLAFVERRLKRPA